jgi:hypothetical protein
MGNSAPYFACFSRALPTPPREICLRFLQKTEKSARPHTWVRFLFRAAVSLPRKPRPAEVRGRLDWRFYPLSERRSAKLKISENGAAAATRFPAKKRPFLYPFAKKTFLSTMTAFQKAVIALLKRIRSAGAFAGRVIYEIRGAFRIYIRYLF